jgi:hypothetical protein
MRLLVGLQMHAEEVEGGLRRAHVPELAVVVEAAVLPEPQHDLERFERASPVLAARGVHVEEHQVARQGADADAEHQAPGGHVIQIGDAVSQLDRVVVRQQVRAGRERDLLRLRQRLRDQQVRRGTRLPRSREVLADPGLVEAQAVEQTQRREILGDALPDPALRRMRRHEERAELHSRPPARCWI